MSGQMRKVSTALAALTLLVFISAATPARAVSAEIIQAVSPDGVAFWLVQEPSIPIISVEIGFRGGASVEPDGREGVVNLLSGMLDEGAGDLDAAAFSRRRDELAARYGFSSGRDAFNVSAAMLSRNLDESVELLRLALTEPRFDDTPLARVKAQVVAGLRRREIDPGDVAGDLWSANAFPGTAYGRNPDGTIESVSALSADDLRAIMPKALNPASAYVGIVGDIDVDAAGALVDRLMGGLPSSEPETFDPLEVKAPASLEVVRMEVPQSVALFGHEGILRSDPDFIPAYVMNYTLGGGGFTSRLFDNVREKEGLAYSVGAYLSPRDRAGLYIGQVASSNDRIARAIELIRAEWTRMAEEGVTPEELEAAKKYLTGAYALRFDSNAKIAGALVGVQMEDLGVNYIRDRNSLVEVVTIEDIKRVAKRLLKPEALHIVVVGDPEGLEAAN